MAGELKLFDVGTISFGGTDANGDASKHRKVRYDWAGDLIEQRQAVIAILLDKRRKPTAVRELGQ